MQGDPGERSADRAPLRARALRGLGAGVLVLIALELGLRLVAPQPPRGLSPGLFEHPGGLSRMVAGATGTQVSRDFAVAIAGDAEGYRAGTSSPPESGVERVWLFGDSQAFGWGVEAEETVSARLIASGVPCANRAIPGDGFGEYRARLEQELATGRRPRAIVVLVYDNDLIETGPAVPRRLRLRSVLLRLHLVRLAARAIDRLGWADAVADATGTRAARAEGLRLDLDLHRVGAAHGDALAELGALLERAASAEAPVLLVRIAPVHAAGGAASARAIETLGASPDAFDFGALDRTLGELASGSGARFARFGPRAEAEERSWYFPHDLHLSPEGHAALARRVATELEALGVR